MRVLESIRTAPKRATALIAVAAAVVTVPAALLAWGPDRPTFTIQKPASYVTFNSITNNPAYGDERNFVRVKEATASNSTYGETANLQAGKEYTVFVYYHNNAATNLNASGKGIAKDVSAKVQIPAVVPNGSNGTKAVGYINSSNAKPTSVWDDIAFKNTTGGDIALRYVPGSATLTNKGKANGSKLSDSIVTSGAKLGYDALDGKVPGCEKFSGYVTFKVKADQPNFTVKKEVRKHGTTGWNKSVEVNPGEKVDYMVSYKNTGTVRQDNVVVKDTMPAHQTYQNGSTMLKNSLNPNGKNVSDSIVSSKGINVSDYMPGAAAYLMFTAKVDEKEKLKCGTTTMVNKATVETDNGSKHDTATVIVKKTCEEPPKKIKVCELATKKIIEIDEKNFDSSKHSKNLDDCKEKPVYIKVCELKTKQIITIDEKNFDSAKHSKNLEDCKEQPKKISVCELATKNIIVIDEKNFDASKHSKNLEDCKEEPKMVEVCDPETGKIITVEEEQAGNYAPVDSDKCKEVEVCVIETKEITTIRKSDYDESKHTTDLSKCEETPVTPEEPETPVTPETPEELPQTGVASVASQIAGLVALTASSAYFAASRRQA